MYHPALPNYQQTNMQSFQTQAASTECASAFKHEAYSHDKVIHPDLPPFCLLAIDTFCKNKGMV